MAAATLPNSHGPGGIQERRRRTCGSSRGLTVRGHGARPWCVTSCQYDPTGNPDSNSAAREESPKAPLQTWANVHTKGGEGVVEGKARVLSGRFRGGGHSQLIVCNVGTQIAMQRHPYRVAHRTASLGTLSKGKVGLATGLRQDARARAHRLCVAASEADGALYRDRQAHLLEQIPSSFGRRR
jgi:hypothetical protein